MTDHCDTCGVFLQDDPDRMESGLCHRCELEKVTEERCTLYRQRDELIDQRDSIREELKKVTAERDAAQKACASAQQAFDRIRELAEAENGEVAEVAVERTINTLRGKCAEMRDALIEIRDVPTVSSRVCLIAAKVLERTDCGKGYRHDREWEPVVEALKLCQRFLPFVETDASIASKQALAHAGKLLKP